MEAGSCLLRKLEKGRCEIAQIVEIPNVQNCKSHDAD